MNYKVVEKTIPPIDFDKYKKNNAVTIFDNEIIVNNKRVRLYLETLKGIDGKCYVNVYYCGYETIIYIDESLYFVNTCFECKENDKVENVIDDVICKLFFDDKKSDSGYSEVLDVTIYDVEEIAKKIGTKNFEIKNEFFSWGNNVNSCMTIIDKRDGREFWYKDGTLYRLAEV